MEADGVIGMLIEGAEHLSVADMEVPSLTLAGLLKRAESLLSF